MQEAQRALDKAKIQLIKNPAAAFYTSICLSLKHKWEESIHTAGTDGVSIFYNPKFFLECTPEERVGVLFHEISHVALDHIARSKNYSKKRYNYAADYVINLQAIEQKFKLPSFALYDTRYKGMTTEQVYALIPDPPADFEIDIMPSPLPPNEHQAHLDNILVKAGLEAQRTGNWGNLPNELQFYIDGLLNPKLPWHSILRKVAMTLVKSGCNFRKPHRRYFPEHILPTRESSSVDKFAVITDTSGSVSDEEFKHYVSETMGVLRQIKPKEIAFVQFDTQIQSVDCVKVPADFKRITFKGRGGTNIKPVLDWIKQNEPKAAVIFTDGDFSPEPYKGRTNIIWIIVNNPHFTSTFGKIIHYTYTA